MPTQWKEAIEMFTDLKVHLMKGTKPYSLPIADIYITKYSCLTGWVDLYVQKYFKSAIFDEAQELRRKESDRYKAAKRLSESVDFCAGMTNTPIYNYGDEIFNVLDAINPHCLGNENDFKREWTGYSKFVKDPQALGTYLRENLLMIRRTRKDVGRELPPINKIVYTVDHDEETVRDAEEIARKLAIKVTFGSFAESGRAARELDIFMRHATGVSKAKSVAQYVRIILESGEPVVLAGWHRDVYDIWLKELKDFNPVMYTGSESPTQKEKAKKAFIDGETNLFIISLRSGVGLDGLQNRCNLMVIGELDWSPKVHDQLIGRVDRDGQPDQVTAIFLVSDFGSDPLIVDMLGLKAFQSNSIMNPFDTVTAQFSDDSRIKLLAQRFLDAKDLERLKEKQITNISE